MRIKHNNFLFKIKTPGSSHFTRKSFSVDDHPGVSLNLPFMWVKNKFLSSFVSPVVNKGCPKAYQCHDPKNPAKPEGSVYLDPKLIFLLAESLKNQKKNSTLFLLPLCYWILKKSPG
jgi:hypothetical protein